MIYQTKGEELRLFPFFVLPCTKFISLLADYEGILCLYFHSYTTKEDTGYATLVVLYQRTEKIQEGYHYMV